MLQTKHYYKYICKETKMKDIDLKQIEQKAYKMFFKDGIWDITMGLLVLSLGFAPLLDEVGIGRPFNIMLVFLPAIFFTLFGKKIITIPRLGLVKFGEERKSDRRKLIIISSAFILVTVFILILLKAEMLPDGINIVKGELTNTLIISVLLLGLPLCFVAFYVDFVRLYLYTALITLSWPAAEIMNSYVGSPRDGMIVFSISGGIPLLIGLYFLITFLRKYPISAETQHFEEKA